MKTIELTQGQVALVDDEDYEKVRGMKFSAYRDCRTWYVKTNEKTIKGKRKTLRLHRLVMGAKPGEIVDHISGDGLDNRKENLRICKSRQNSQNRQHKRSGATSDFMGVSFYRRTKKWQIQIQLNGQKSHLGYFSNEIAAAKAYDEAAVKYFGEFACPNFPYVGQTIKPKSQLNQ